MRKVFAGAAAPSQTTSSMTTGSTSFTMVPQGTWPTTGPFVVVIDRGLASEEKVLVQSRSGNTMTVASGGRGYDGTTAKAHASGAWVHHVLDSVTIAEANRAANPGAGTLAGRPTADGTQGVYRTTDGNGTFVDIAGTWRRLVTDEDVPQGGGTGEVLAKASGDDYDTEWVDLTATYVASPEVRSLVVVTESEYGALDPPNPNTFYIVVEDG